MSVLVQILDQDTQSLLLRVDVSLSESHEGDAEATDHPVEQGANVTDHIRPKPQQLTIEGFVSNTPLISGQSAQAQDLSYPPDMPGPAEQAFAILESRRVLGKLHTVVTRLATYSHMALLSRPVVRNAQVGDALTFKAVFKEIRLVTTTTALIQTALPQGQPGVKTGQKPATAVQPAAQSANQTLLVQGGVALGLLPGSP
jgi:hypothetical protein